MAGAVRARIEEQPHPAFFSRVKRELFLDAFLFQSSWLNARTRPLERIRDPKSSVERSRA